MSNTQNFNDWDQSVIEEFRTNGGKVGGMFSGVPILLITTTGAKSGVQRTRPLAYLSDGGNTYIFAGNRGGPTNPAWYHNLLTHPDVTVEIGTDKFIATAIILDETEAERLGRVQLQKLPGLADTMSKITRKVPAIMLKPQE